MWPMVLLLILDCSEKKKIFESCDHDFECSETENANVCRRYGGYGNLPLCLVTIDILKIY